MTKAVQEMPNVYFIRHNFTNPKDAAILQKRKRIAIRFNDESFHKWEQYSTRNRDETKFKRAWTQFQKIKRNGGIVVAQYGREEYLIGQVKKGSRLKFIPSYKAKGHKSLKSLQLHNVKQVTARQRHMITMFKPRQSTVNPMRKSADYVRCAYGLSRHSPSLDKMHYKSQESMCAEWLRSKYCPPSYRLQYLLANIGHGMESVDILARTKSGKNLYAQVTYSKDQKKVIKKRDTLLQFSEGDRTKINIMFSNATFPKDNHTVLHVPLQQVWDELYGDSKYKKMIRAMLGL